MKAMMVSDFIAMKKQLLQTSALMAIIALSFWLVVFDSPLLIVYLVCIETIIAVQGLMIETGKGSWEGTRLALPLSRAQVVSGRYASLAAIAVGTAVLATLLYLAVCAIGFAFPAVQDITRFHVAFDPSALALCAGASIALALMSTGILLPIFVRLNTINAMRFGVAALMLALMFGTQALGASGVFPQGALALEANLASALGLSLGLVVMGAAFYVASATIAIRLYNRRDF